MSPAPTSSAALLVGERHATEVRRELSELGLACSEADAASAAVLARKIGPRVILVDLSGEADLQLAALEALHRSFPTTPVVALADRKDPDLILRAVRSGAREFAVPAQPGELRRVLGDLIKKAAAARSPGTIVSVFPAKGGSGATTLAANLAGSLVQDGHSAVLVDLNLQLGDALVFLDLASRFTLAQVLANMKRLDRDLLLASVARHSSGVHVLSQSDHLEEADQVQPGQIGALLAFLGQHFDYVLVDGLGTFDEMAVAALDASDRVLLVAMQNIPSVRNAHRCAELFRRLRYSDSKVKLVVNRYQKAEPITLEAIVENLGHEVAAVVGNDYAAVSGAISKGLLLPVVAPRAKVTADIQQLARTIAGRDATERSGGFLRSLFGRKATNTTEDEGGPGHGTQRATEAV